MLRSTLIIKILLICCLLLPSFGQIPSVVMAQGERHVTVIHLSGEIDASQLALVERAYRMAAEQGSAAVILEMDTFGGLVDSATKIRDRIVDSPVTTICFIRNRAWSAGALIALAHQHIVMAPGGSIGAAEPIPTTEKTVAALKAEFAATAGQRGRDPAAAAAMVDKSLGYPGYVKPGEILAFTDKQAVTAGFADQVLPDLPAVLAQYGFGDATVDNLTMSSTEKVVGYLSDPAVKGFLVTLIFLAILTEVKTAGSGIGALIGIFAAALLIGSQWLTGGGWLPALLFFGGVILIAAELFIPGTAIFAISGLILMLSGLFLVLGGDTGAVQYLAGSLVAALSLFFLLARKLPTSTLWARFVLKDSEKTAQGYTSSLDYSAMVGKKGVALTLLRPAGTALIAGKKLDVVTEGQYVAATTEIIVVAVSGRRIVVEEINQA